MQTYVTNATLLKRL